MRKVTFGAVLLGLSAGLPQAASAGEISASFNVDVGPMTTTVVKFDLTTTEDSVRSRARIKSNGISRAFSEYSVEAEAEARTGKDGVQPVSFKLVRESDDRRKETALSWNEGGELTFTPPIKKPEMREKVSRALSKDVADPMTVILRLGAAGANPCPSVHHVFDGRDVFELSFADKGRGKLDSEASYHGEVQHCEVRWTPLAGRAMEKKLPGDVYQVAFAPVGKLASGAAVWLPVAMSGKLKGLGFSAYVTKLKIDDAGAPAAASQ